MWQKVNIAAVFWIGAAMALISLSLSRLVPSDPREGHELVWGSAVKKSVIGAAD